MRESRRVSRWARSGSLHREGSATCCSSSAVCERFPSTSKELLRGGDALGELLDPVGVVGHVAHRTGPRRRGRAPGRRGGPPHLRGGLCSPRGEPGSGGAGRSSGPYRLEEQLGEGAVGLVFHTVREPEGDEVALKVLRPELSGDETLRRRFVHDARAASEVRHKHLVTILDAGEVDGRSYLAVAFVRGRTLERRLEDEGPLPIPEMVRIVAEIAAGLDTLHRAEIIHRDVKPSNVMLDTDGAAALTDFGLAKGRAYTVLTKPGQVMGTLDYLAPEMLRGADATPASDCTRSAVSPSSASPAELRSPIRACSSSPRRT